MTRTCTSLIALTSVAVSLAAQQPSTAGSFRFERAVVTARPGPQRLAIDLPLLSGGDRFRVSGEAAFDGLADLRLFDASGATVPHLLVQPPRGETTWTGTTILPAPETETTSGFEADLGARHLVDAIDIGGLPEPLLKRFELVGSADRERWVVLEREGTIFSLPRESLRRTEIEFAPGEYRYLRVTWDDANSARAGVPSDVRARQTTLAAAGERLSAVLPVQRRPSEPGRSRYRVRLPAGGLPIVALDVHLPPQHVYRDAAVYGTRLMDGALKPDWLGGAQLRQVLGDEIVASELRIRIERPEDLDIELVIEDGQNPPLDVRSVTAVFADLPWIYFEAPAGPVVARYGRRGSKAPTYDLEAARSSLDILAVPEARWAGVEALEATDPAPFDAPAPGLGAAPDAFTYVRALVSEGEGLVSV